LLERTTTLDKLY